jgi:ureidoacrylate peracid hydrolase
MPILVCIDIQKEYETEGRPFFIRGVGKSLDNGKKILAHARRNDWKIYHVRHERDGEPFQKGSPYSGFIAGFEPKEGEREIVKGNYSCYSAPEFAKEMERHRSDEVVVIGYGSTKCCLATIVDGYHRGQKFVYVADASNAKRTDEFDENSLHRHATEILKSFARITTTDELLRS